MLFYDVHGEGRPVMLVHGFGEDHRVWEGLIAFLQPGYRLIIPHLPGTGRSPATDHLSMESMAAELKTIADKEDLKKFTLIGHSMGGYISLAFAEKFSERLNGLGLFHSTAAADGDTKIESRKKSIEFLREHGTAAFLQSTTQNLFAAENRALMAETIAAIANSNTYIGKETMIAFQEAMINRKDQRSTLEINAFPILFILGKHDQAVPFAESLKLVHLPDLSYIHILQQSGHMGMLEEPVKANQYLKDFVDQV